MYLPEHTAVLLGILYDEETAQKLLVRPRGGQYGLSHTINCDKVHSLENNWITK